MDKIGTYLHLHIKYRCVWLLEKEPNIWFRPTRFEDADNINTAWTVRLRKTPEGLVLRNKLGLVRGEKRSNSKSRTRNRRLLEIDKHYSLELCFSIEKQSETVSH